MIEVAKFGFILLAGAVLALVGAAAFKRIPLLMQPAESGPVARVENPLIGVWMMHDPQLGIDCSYEYSADTMQSDCENGGQVTPVTYAISGATATVSYAGKVDVISMVSHDEFVTSSPTNPSVHLSRYRCDKDDRDLCAAEFSKREPTPSSTLLAVAASPPAPGAPAPAAVNAVVPRGPAPKNFPIAAVALFPPPTPPAQQAAAPEPPASAPPEAPSPAP